ncbi:MAG: GIN domain-containing protein [Bacteroidia bacterium]
MQNWVLDIRFKYYLFIVAVVLSSCKKAEDRACFKSLGKVTTEIRSLNNFKHIYISDNIELQLTPSTKNEVSINSPKNLLNFITTEVRNDTLYIANKNKCNILRSYQHNIVADVSFTDLHYIKSYSSQDIRSTSTLNLDTLITEGFFVNGDVYLDFNGTYLATIVHSGGRNVTVRGNAFESYAYHIGTGSIFYENLNVEKTHIHSRTTADCYITATKKISIEIHSGGNVYYDNSTKPEVTIKQRGDGKAIPF